MGSSLASYFMVFHGLLSNRLQTAVDLCRTAHSADRGGSSAGPSNSSGHGQQQGAASSNARTSASFEGLCRELADSCAGSQHTYLHAQVGVGLERSGRVMYVSWVLETWNEPHHWQRGSPLTSSCHTRRAQPADEPAEAGSAQNAARQVLTKPSFTRKVRSDLPAAYQQCSSVLQYMMSDTMA